MVVDTQEGYLSICNICLDPLLEQGRRASTATNEDWNVRLGCGCAFHHACFVGYVSMKLGDRDSLRVALTRTTSTRGVLCPNASQRSASCPGHLVTREEFTALHEEATARRAGRMITQEMLDKLQRWVFSEEEEQENNSDDNDNNNANDNNSNDNNDNNSTTNNDANINSNTGNNDNGNNTSDCRNNLKKQVSIKESNNNNNNIQSSNSTSIEEEDATEELLKATTRSCPQCGFRASHAHGHGCHHISPFGGCRRCHTHFCYRCLSSAHENTVVRGREDLCRCGYWSNFCAPLTRQEDVRKYLCISPYPHDVRCFCIICSECQRAQPCQLCDGNCAVCLGYLPPGPLSLEDVARFEQALLEWKRTSSLFSEIKDACEDGDLDAFLETRARVSAAEFAMVLQESDADDRTLLFIVTEKNATTKTLKIAEEMCKAGADVMAISRNSTPLLNAMLGLVTQQNQSRNSCSEELIRKREHLVRLMLSKVSSDNIPLLCAVVGSFIKHDWLLRCIIAQFPAEEWWDVKGRNLLYYLMENRRFELADFILANNSSATVNVTHENVPLLALIAEKSMETYNNTVNNVKNRLLRICYKTYHFQDAHGNTVLHALLYFYLNMASDILPNAELAWADRSVDRQTCSPGATPNEETRMRNLRTGVVNLIVRLVNHLCESKSLQNASLPDDQGNTILHLLVRCPVELLLLKIYRDLIRTFPALLLCTNTFGETPLHVIMRECSLAALNTALEALDILSPTMCPFRLQDLRGETPLHTLCEGEAHREQQRMQEAHREQTPIDSTEAEPDSRRQRANSVQSIDSSSYVQSTRFYDVLSFLFKHYDTNILSLLFSVPDCEGRTVLHRLALHGCFVALTYLLKFAQKHDVALPILHLDRERHTPLYCALLAPGIAHTTDIWLKHRWEGAQQLLRWEGPSLSHLSHPERIFYCLSLRNAKKETIFHSLALRADAGFEKVTLDLIALWRTAAEEWDSSGAQLSTRQISLSDILSHSSGRSGCGLLEILAFSPSPEAFKLLNELVKDDTLSIVPPVLPRHFDTGKSAAFAFVAAPRRVSADCSRSSGSFVAAVSGGVRTGETSLFRVPPSLILPSLANATDIKSNLSILSSQSFLSHSQLSYSFVSSLPVKERLRALDTLLHSPQASLIQRDFNGETVFHAAAQVGDIALLRYYLCDRCCFTRDALASLFEVRSLSSGETILSLLFHRMNALLREVKEDHVRLEEDQTPATTTTAEGDLDNEEEEEEEEEIGYQHRNKSSKRPFRAKASKTRARAEHAERQEDEFSVELFESKEDIDNDEQKGVEHRSAQIPAGDPHRNEVEDALQLCISLLAQGALSSNALAFSIDGLAFHHWLFLRDECLLLFHDLMERGMIAFTPEEISLLFRHALDLDTSSFSDECMIDDEPLLLWLCRQRHCSARLCIIYIAARNGYLKDWKIRDKEERSAMHIAATENDLPLVRLFALLHIVPPSFFLDEKDGGHCSCFDCAREANHVEIKEFLLDLFDADINRCSSSPLDSEYY